MGVKSIIKESFKRGEGILRLIPTFVPRRFGRPGFRLRLDPDDYYALGLGRGAIKERWFSSTLSAMNGPDAPADEGMSYVLPVNDNTSEKFLFKDAIDELGAEIVGDVLYEKYRGWPMYSKFFDYSSPLFLHLHLCHDAATRIGRLEKPEAYYFPKQLNNYLGEFPVSFFGLDPSVTKAEVRERLLKYEIDDNKINELSRAYKIVLGTGWYMPPGVLHAPGSVLTYEPQWNSDVNSVFENVTAGEIYPREFLVENCPEDKQNDIDYVIDLLDWEKNIDPFFKARYFRPPIRCNNSGDDWFENWIVYANEYICAKELVINPRSSVIVKDNAAYGCIIIQGYGRFGVYRAESATMLRFGQPSADEYFVSEDSAKAGVEIVNESQFENMVILKHFGPNNPDIPRTVLRPD
ncbi:MAG: hypothetical protein ACTSXU_03370 [Promethearchaeota archaeon]